MKTWEIDSLARKVGATAYKNRYHEGQSFAFSGSKLQEFAEEVEKQTVLQWVDGGGVSHTLTQKVAVEVLKSFYESWPGGLEEVDSTFAHIDGTLRKLQTALENSLAKR